MCVSVCVCVCVSVCVYTVTCVVVMIQVLLNMSYALVQIGHKSEALEKLNEANQGSRETGEQRHQIVKTAYDAARVS